MTEEEFLAHLNTAYLRREEWLQSNHERSLSFTDAMFDRWERARRLGFAEGANIYNSALVFGQVSVGENTWIGPFCVLDGSGGGLSIGAWCAISAGVQIYTHDTVLWALSGGAAPRKTASVQIGARCYIGSQSIIAAGVEIGEQSVVAANSFVNRSVPPRTIVGGSPARVLGEVAVDGDQIKLRYLSEHRRDG